MPRSAATIFGLVLVAASIGFNTWRYPIVWRMAGPIAAPEVAVASPQPPTATPAAPRAEPPKAELPSAAPLPAPLMEDAAKPTADARSTAVEHPAPAPTNLERPLAPVPRMATMDKTTGADAAAAVRRLPPVDPNVPPAAVGYVSAPGNAVPMYPSTGIE